MKYFLCLIFIASFVLPSAAQIEEPAGKIYNAEGVVRYLKAASTVWTQVRSSKLLEAGDKVRTDPESRTELSLKDGSIIRLGADSVLSLEQVTPKYNSVEMIAGKLQAAIHRASDRKFIARTISALCETSEAVFELEVDSAGVSTVSVTSGTIQVSDSANNSVTLSPGQRLIISHEKGLQAPPPAVVEAPSEQESTGFRGSAP